MGQTNPVPIRPISVPTTANQRLTDRLVRDATGAGIVDWMAHQRDQGLGWEEITHLLANLTGHRISYTTLAKWGREWGL